MNPLYSSDEDYKSKIGKAHDTLFRLQELLYAEQQQALLIVFQGMDTAGKDGAIRHVMSGVNPQGCDVSSFKVPTSTELAHDFMWRVNQNIPQRGKIGIFNRSYYEDVLVTRVHPEILKGEPLPKKVRKLSHFWQHRCEDILNYEKYLIHQGYSIIKIFLHISKAEQKRRLLDRFKDPSKLWKLQESDIKERQFWDEYQDAYSKCFEKTSFKQAPWTIVPADDKKNARLKISKIIIDRLVEMNPKIPGPTAEKRRRLVSLEKLLGR